MANALIAGCGYVGAEVGAQLHRLGHRVWGLRRNPVSSLIGIDAMRADLLDPSSLRELPDSIDVVFYTAAADAQTDDAYRAAYVDGLRNLLAALAEQGQTPQRIFFTSSTAVYGQSGGECVDESSETAPTSFTGLRMLEAEAVLRSAPFPSTVLRLGGIYGPGRTHTITSVRTGSARIAAGAPVYMNHIHRDDCAGALVHLMSLPRPEALYVGVDSAPADRSEVLAWLADQLGASLPARVPLSEGPVRGAKRCSNARLLQSGYIFQFPTYREGYGALLHDGA